MAEQLVLIGIILLFVSILLIVVGTISSGKDIKYGFGGFIGPIPFGFANDPRIFWIILSITLLIILIFIFPLIKGMI